MQVYTRSYPMKLTLAPKNATKLRIHKLYDLSLPQNIAALTIASLMVYPKDPEASIAMLATLKGEKTLSDAEVKLLNERFTAQPYLADSYFEGAEVDNGYTPTKPYQLTFFETPDSRNQWAEGLLTLYVLTSGAVKPRAIVLQKKKDKEEWLLQAHALLDEIDQPQ